MLSNLARYMGRHHVALLALFVALGGTSYATVVNVPRNSVDTQHLKRNAVKPAKLAPNAVRTAHVLDGSLLAKDFKAGQLPQGPKGDRGEKGDKGDPGATNVVVRTQRPCPGGLPQDVHCVMRPMCEAGERAVGGGGGFDGNLGKVLRLTHEGAPAPGNPYASRGGVAREFWSIGHRNLLGLDFAPARTMSLNNIYVRWLEPSDLLEAAGFSVELAAPWTRDARVVTFVATRT